MIYILTILLTVIIIVLSCIMGFHYSIHLEKKRKIPGPTTNRLPPFKMHIHSVKRGILFTKVIGINKGSIPKRGNVVYLESIPVFIFSIHPLQNQQYTYKLTLYGLPSKININKGEITNVRKASKVELEPITYPLILKRGTNTLFTCLGIMILFGIGMLFCIYDLVKYNQSIIVIFSLIMMGILFVFGFYMLIDYLTFKAVITENDILIYKKKNYRIKEISYTVTYGQNNNLNLNLYDHDQLILILNSTDQNYNQAYHLIKESIEQYHREQLYEELLHKNYYLPLTNNGYVVINDTDGNPNLLVFDTIEELEKIDFKDLAGDEIVSLEEIYQLTDHFTKIKSIYLDLKTVKGVTSFIIDQEIWKEIQRFIDLQA